MEAINEFICIAKCDVSLIAGSQQVEVTSPFVVISSSDVSSSINSIVTGLEYSEEYSGDRDRCFSIRILNRSGNPISIENGNISNQNGEYFILQNNSSCTIVYDGTSYILTM